MKPLLKECHLFGEGVRLGVLGVSLGKKMEKVLVNSKRNKLAHFIAAGMLSLIVGFSASLKAKSSLVKEPTTVEELDAWTKEVLEKHELLVLYFSSKDCGSCKFLSPIVEELAVELQGQVSFCKISVENEIFHPTMGALGVVMFPWIVIRKGDIFATLPGARSKNQFRGELLNYIKMELDGE